MTTLFLKICRVHAKPARLSRRFSSLPKAQQESNIVQKRTDWGDTSTQYQALKDAEKELNISSPTDWYTITKSMLPSKARRLIKSKYNDSLRTALLTLFPEYGLDAEKFRKAPPRASVPSFYWHSIANQRALLDEIGKKLGVTKFEDWYSVPVKQLALHGAGSLMAVYNGSVAKTIMTVYASDFNWELDKFRTVTVKSWQALKSSAEDSTSSEEKEALTKLREEIVEEAKTKLGIKKDEDWYKVTQSQLPHKMLKMINRLYGGSLAKCLMALYPGKFEQWRLRMLSSTDKSKNDAYHNYIANRSPEVLKKAFDFAAEKLQIKEYDDWYRVSFEQITKVLRHSLVHSEGGLKQILPKIYPEHNWELWRFDLSTKKASQRYLGLILKQLLTTEESSLNIQEDCTLQAPEGILPSQVELDFYIPELKLAVEYNGEHHYKEIRYFGNYRELQMRDTEKPAFCEQLGITLVIIPYTVKLTTHNVASILYNIRNDIKLNYTFDSPPPLPRGYTADESANVEVLVDFQKWSNPDPTGWYMTPKVSGIRCRWIPSTNMLVTKYGSEVTDATAEWKQKMPQIPLDGILYIPGSQRCVPGHFKKASNWRKAKFYIIDALISSSLSERMDALKSTASNSEVAVFEEPTVCTSAEHLNSFVGEHSALLLRKQQDSGYSKQELFVHKFYQTSQVTVLGVRTNTCALLCEQDDGQTVHVSCSPSMLLKPPLNQRMDVLHHGKSATGKLVTPFVR